MKSESTILNGKPDTENILLTHEIMQKTTLLNGNEAAARAIMDIGFDGEGYYPITPSSEVGEIVSKYVADGKTDLSFVVGTSELAALGIVTGMAIAGGRALDVTSSQGLLLKAEEMPLISGLGLPVVLNLSAREVSGPLNIKVGHSDLAACLGWGWIILLAPTVQAVYDMNIIAVRLAEAVNLPAIVCYDGFLTSHGSRRVSVFESREDVANYVGPKPKRLNVLDVKDPHTFGPYMNDDLINTKVQLEGKMNKAYGLLPTYFEEFYQMSGRKYDFVQTYGDDDAESTLVILNSAAHSSQNAIDVLREQGHKVKLITPLVLRPWPEKEMVKAIPQNSTLVVAERVSQYGAGNYLANEIGASLQKCAMNNRILSRVYGLGGIAFTSEDSINLIKLGLSHPKEDSLSAKEYYGAWSGNPNYNPPQTLEPLTVEETTLNAGMDKIDLRKLAEMPNRIDKHTACPGCGIFTNLNLFLRGIDGHVVLLFNTGCGMVVTTGYPLTSFKVPYVHNLFHNVSSTATGVVEMYKRFKAQGKIKEEITFVCVSGDGGDDIGMDQLIGSALRNDPIIFLEYDNKGYMNTGGQLCYTGIKGQRNSNAHLGPHQKGKMTHHKDIIEILRGTNCSYLFQAAESNARDMIMKARKAQQTVRNGGFAFGKVFSTCPLNWGAEPSKGPSIVDLAVKTCLHPLYEVEKGITKLNYNPEKAGKKAPVTDLFKILGTAFRHLATPEYQDIALEIQNEVDRRWERLVEMEANPKL
jgi:pyruvate ferredoxin oxidoreductase alpha subunit